MAEIEFIKTAILNKLKGQFVNINEKEKLERIKIFKRR